MRTFISILFPFLMVFSISCFGQKEEIEEQKGDSVQVRFGKKVQFRSYQKEGVDRDSPIFGKMTDTIRMPSSSGEKRGKGVRFGKKVDTIRFDQQR